VDEFSDNKALIERRVALVSPHAIDIDGPVTLETAPKLEIMVA
jgi:hypothetical protein